MTALNTISIRRMLGLNIGERVRELLEDYEIAGAGTSYMALVPNYPTNKTLINNVQAAVTASHLRLHSIDYAKRKYCEDRVEDKSKNKGVVSEYINAYKSAKNHIEKEISRSMTEEKSLPSSGVFGAYLVLERLVASFFSAHLLYRLGNEYEAHAVSRLILEQIAWAYVAYPFANLSDIQKITTTKTISELKKITPECARLYGFLSKKTHIDYNSHIEFLQVQDERNVILLSRSEYYDYAQVILTLADLFGIVWEISQFDYMSKKESVKKRENLFIVKQNRPFLKIIENHLSKIKKAETRSTVQT